MDNTDQNPHIPFTQQEMLTLQRLHLQYQRDHDRFSDRERARLQFLRWLFEVERLDSEPKVEPPRHGDSAGRTQGPAEEE